MVNITIKGTSRGTIVDYEGFYALTRSPGDQYDITIPADDTAELYLCRSARDGLLYLAGAAEEEVAPAS